MTARHPLTSIRGSIDIARPVPDVFDLVADQRNEVRYNPDMLESHQVTGGPIGVGTVFEATVRGRRRPIDVTIECVGYDPPHRLASRSRTAGTVIDGELRFAPTTDGTRMSWNWHVRLSGAARLAGPLVAVIGRRQERRIWSGLKRYLEAGSAS